MWETVGGGRVVNGRVRARDNTVATAATLRTGLVCAWSRACSGWL